MCGRFEEGLYRSVKGKYGLSSRLTIDRMDETFSVKACLNWFDMVLAALDCYCWVFGQGLLTPAMFAGALSDVQRHESSIPTFQSVMKNHGAL